MSRQHTLSVVLFAAVLISALAVVYSKHQSRALFVELQALETARDELGIEWGRLQLEQSAWAVHARIESVATKRLRMRLPAVSSIIAVAP